MRTVTFSDPALAAFVNRNFVSVWKNRSMGFNNCEMATERCIAIHKGEIFPTRNICTFILDAEKRCSHLFSGHYAPSPCRSELEFALKVHRATHDENGHMKPDAAAAYVALHKERSEARSKESLELRKMTPKVPEGFLAEMQAIEALFPDPKAADHTAEMAAAGPAKIGPAQLKGIVADRLGHYIGGLQHLRQVSRELSMKAAQALRIPELEKVLRAHNSADPFAEE